MDEKLKNTMTNLVRNSSEEEVVGIIMTHIYKVQLLEAKVSDLQQTEARLILELEQILSNCNKN
jgi:hypothetical protein